MNRKWRTRAPAEGAAAPSTLSLGKLVPLIGSVSLMFMGMVAVGATPAVADSEGSYAPICDTKDGYHYDHHSNLCEKDALVETNGTMTVVYVGTCSAGQYSAVEAEAALTEEELADIAKGGYTPPSPGGPWTFDPATGLCTLTKGANTETKPGNITDILRTCDTANGWQLKSHDGNYRCERTTTYPDQTPQCNKGDTFDPQGDVCRVPRPPSDRELCLADGGSWTHPMSVQHTNTPPKGHCDYTGRDECVASGGTWTDGTADEANRKPPIDDSDATSTWTCLLPSTPPAVAVTTEGAPGGPTPVIDYCDNLEGVQWENYDCATGAVPVILEPAPAVVVDSATVAAVSPEAATVPTPAKKPAKVVAPQAAVVPAAVPAGGGSSAPGSDVPPLGLLMIVVGTLGAMGAGLRLTGARSR